MHQHMKCAAILPTGNDAGDFVVDFVILNGGLAAFFTQAVNGSEMRNREQPVSQFAARRIPSPRLIPHFEEGILRHFFCPDDILQNPVGKAVDGFAVFLIKLSQCVLVTTGDTLHHFDFVQCVDQPFVVSPIA